MEQRKEVISPFSLLPNYEDPVTLEDILLMLNVALSKSEIFTKSPIFFELDKVTESSDIVLVFSQLHSAISISGVMVPAIEVDKNRFELDKTNQVPILGTDDKTGLYFYREGDNVRYFFYINIDAISVSVDMQNLEAVARCKYSDTVYRWIRDKKISLPIKRFKLMVELIKYAQLIPE